MVGRQALRFLSVALLASASASSALAQTRAPDSDLAGLVFPTQSRDWSSDPGGFKAATLDLAAALTGKACGAEEFHAWTIRDFAAGVTLSEAVDESFRTAGWRLDLVSRDSELSRIYLASRGDDGLILNWMPDEGVVGLLICVAAELGSVPERVAEAATTRPFSLDPTMPPLPLPRPSPEAIAAAQASAALADAAQADPAAQPGAPTEIALAEAATIPGTPAPIANEALPGAESGAAPAEPPLLAQTALAGAGDPSAAPPTTDAPAPALAGPQFAEPAAPSAAAPLADPVVVAATSPAGSPATSSLSASPELAPGLEAATPAAPSAAATPTAPTVVATAPPQPSAGPTPTRTPIDLGMTAAILDDGPASAAPAETALAADPAPPPPSLSAMYERAPPLPGLIDPVSVADRTAAIPAPPELEAAASLAQAPLTLAQGPDVAAAPVEVAAEQIPVTTVLAPVLEPGGLPVWPFFLLAVLLAGAGLAIIVRRAVPPAPPPSALWPTALASVVGADLDERVGDAGIEFTPVLRYRFSVGENEFEAVTEGWGGRSLPTRSAAEAVIAGFPDHARVEISYDPTDPTRVMLPEAPRPADPMLMVAAGCLALAALTLVLTLV